MGSSSSLNCSFSLDDLDNDEILLEILVKLPIKLVHRCKCVSKRWYSLISDSYFACQYSIRRPKYSPSQFTFLRYNRPGEEGLFKHHHGFSLSFLPLSKLLYILASCNGLVLCGEGLVFPCTYYICNPLTLQWLELPQLPSPKSVASMIGFVCDGNGTNYNVVRMPMFTDWRNQFKVVIFSSETMKWSEMTVYCPRKFCPHGSSKARAICWNGVIYWLITDHGVITYDIYNRIDNCSFIDSPKPLNSYLKNTEVIGICLGCLRLSRITKVGRENSFIEVWELTNGKMGEWRLDFNICVHDLVMDGGRNEMSVYIVAFDAMDADVLYVCGSTAIFSCNLRKKTLEYAFSNRTSIAHDLQASAFVLPWWPTPLLTPTVVS